MQALLQEGQRGVVDRDENRNRDCVIQTAWCGVAGLLEPGFVLLANIALVELALDGSF